MLDMSPRFHHEQSGLAVSVYAHQVLVIAIPAGMAGRYDLLDADAIATVTEQRPGLLCMTTTDGRTTWCDLGAQATAARQAILTILPQTDSGLRSLERGGDHPLW
jgi:hypothetical protein